MVEEKNPTRNIHIEDRVEERCVDILLDQKYRA